MPKLPKHFKNFFFRNAIHYLLGMHHMIGGRCTVMFTSVLMMRFMIVGRCMFVDAVETIKRLLMGDGTSNGKH